MIENINPQELLGIAKNAEIISPSSWHTYALAKKNMSKLSELKDIADSYIDEHPEMKLIYDLYSSQKDNMIQFTTSHLIPCYESKYLATNIEYLAKLKEIRVPDLEVIFGISNGYISRTLNPESKKRLSVDIVWELAEFFDVSINDLLNRDLTLPAKGVEETVDFLKQIQADTDKGILLWNNVGKVKDHRNEELFAGANNEYCPFGYENSYGEVLEDDIFSTKTPVGRIFIVKTSDLFSDAYEMYAVEGSVATTFYRILWTQQDKSGVLYNVCDELFKCIKFHQNDFVVEDGAKNLMGRYMQLRANQEEFNFE